MITIGATGDVEVAELEHITLDRTGAGWRGRVTMRVSNRGREESVSTEWDDIGPGEMSSATRQEIVAWARKCARRHFGVTP